MENDETYLCIFDIRKVGRSRETHFVCPCATTMRRPLLLPREIEFLSSYIAFGLQLVIMPEKKPTELEHRSGSECAEQSSYSEELDEE